ncbi:gem-associated protein 6 isoform X2 [Macrotis lagotis]|uniref:gem-associated protein 6 isoform X2 n=1 Tax=Macrotis lagotis TaxID=92651 RepID=UPI003D681A25
MASGLGAQALRKQPLRLQELSASSRRFEQLPGPGRSGGRIYTPGPLPPAARMRPGVVTRRTKARGGSGAERYGRAGAAWGRGHSLPWGRRQPPPGPPPARAPSARLPLPPLPSPSPAGRRPGNMGPAAPGAEAAKSSGGHLGRGREAAAPPRLTTMNEWMKKSPLEWQDYVYKEVRVTASEKNEYKGWVLTTDPVSANIVLVNFLEDGAVAVTGVMGHAVQTVEVLNEDNQEVRDKLMHMFMPEESKAYNPEDLEKRKISLKSWLEKNHIPITEQGESQSTLCVAGVLTIEPPYGPEDCCSSNEIILSRVQDLIQGHLKASQ